MTSLSMTVKDRIVTVGVLAGVVAYTAAAFILGMFTEWCIHHG